MTSVAHEYIPIFGNEEENPDGFVECAYDGKLYPMGFMKNVDGVLVFIDNIARYNEHRPID